MNCLLNNCYYCYNFCLLFRYINLIPFLTVNVMISPINIRIIRVLCIIVFVLFLKIYWNLFFMRKIYQTCLSTATIIREERFNKYVKLITKCDMFYWDFLKKYNQSLVGLVINGLNELSHAPVIF